MGKEYFVFIKTISYKKIVYIDYERLGGYEVTPRNKVKYDGIIVNKLIIINPSFSQKIFIKKSKKQLEKYLQYLINISNSEDDADPNDVYYALDSLVRYKSIVRNKYRLYLDKKYYQLFLQKLEIIETELHKKYNYLKRDELNIGRVGKKL